MYAKKIDRNIKRGGSANHLTIDYQNTSYSFVLFQPLSHFEREPVISRFGQLLPGRHAARNRINPPRAEPPGPQNTDFLWHPPKRFTVIEIIGEIQKGWLFVSAIQ